MCSSDLAAVYDDCDADYASLFATMLNKQGPLQSALNTICPHSDGHLRLVNFTGQRRDGELVEFHTDDDISGLVIRTQSGSNTVQSIVHADGSTSFAAPLKDIPAMEIGRASCRERL